MKIKTMDKSGIESQELECHTITIEKDGKLYRVKEINDTLQIVRHYGEVKKYTDSIKNRAPLTIQVFDSFISLK